MEAGIELVLGGGRRLRIPKGVDEETLRSVLKVDPNVKTIFLLQDV